VSNLRDFFKSAGGDLLVKFGKPEVILPDLVAKYKVNEVYHHREVASEETKVSADDNSGKKSNKFGNAFTF
jgi:deoxyribodipyrimidine photo-lyase